MADDDALSQLDPILAAADTSTSPWDGDRYVPDYDLARRLLAVPVGLGWAKKQQSGRTAKALDAWIAHELRRSGFPESAVWPRRVRPRTRPDDLEKAERAVEVAHERLNAFEKRLDLYAAGAATKGFKSKPPSLREARSGINGIAKALPGSANADILGRFYVKQVDVVASSWQRGPDVLVSSKTQFSSYLNNKNNRYEEAVGEAANLRDRHPMAAMGFAFLVRSNVFQEKDAFPYLRNQLARLRKPDGLFDATMLLAAEWDDETLTVTSVEDPTDALSAPRFFSDLLAAVMDNAPIDIHEELRNRRDAAPEGVAPDVASGPDDLDLPDA